MFRALVYSITSQFMKNNLNTKSQDLLAVLHGEFKKRYVSMSDRNWNKQLVSFVSKTLLFSGESNDERIVSGWVAALTERAYYVAAHKKPISTRQRFESQLKELVLITPLPKFLTRPGQILCGKRQPSFIESILPTLERFEVMERLQEVFPSGVDSIIVGGSMSYGAFYSVRGGHKEKDTSDIDALVVVNNDFFRKSLWKKFVKNDLFHEEENQKFLERIGVFQKLFRSKAADVLSQRFSVRGKFFTVSLHFIPFNVFSRMVYSDLKVSLRKKSDTHYILRDFRMDSFRHPCHARHTFTGERIESFIDGFEVGSGGFVSFMPGYTISSGNFYPGVYHTVISPSFLVFYDRDGKTTRLVRKFENLLYIAVKHARKEFPSATYAKAHNRYDIFAPGRFDEGLNSFITKKDLEKYTPKSDCNFLEVKTKYNKGELFDTQVDQIKKNSLTRANAIDFLLKWKKDTLKNFNKEIDYFINKENSDLLLSLAKKQNHHWYMVAVIQCSKKILVKLLYPYMSVDSKNTIIKEEIYTQTISPSDIMSLKSYEKLTLKFGKVYVASIANPANSGKNSPVSYGLVIRT